MGYDVMSRPVVLITGAAKRAGREFALYFARHGYEVVVHHGASIDDAAETVELIGQEGGHACALRADLREAHAIERLLARVFERFGRLDLLVNNASVFWQDHFPDFSAAQLDESWSVNCRAPILLIQAFYECAKRTDTRGVAINVVDQKVRGNFHRDHFSYTVGKTALGHLTQMLAIATSPILRVNAVFPGLMLPSDNQTESDFEYASHEATPLKRIADPTDVAAAILLLASPAYNGFDFVVDAGQNLVRVEQDVLYTHRTPGQPD